MDQNLALKLFETGGFLIFLDVPHETEFGVDFKSWKTDVKFRGLKMIPPGLHFIFYSPVSATTGDSAPRSGFFHNFRAGEVIVRKWNKKLEEIESVGEDEVVNFREDIKGFDEFLAPYPFEIYEKWKNLTLNISSDLVESMVPKCGIVRSALELEGCSDADRPRESNEDNSKRRRISEEALLPKLNPKTGTDLRFTKFPERPYPDGSTPAEITQHSLDHSFLFEEFLKKYTNQVDIIGEVQFSFICFLIGHSLEAFEQWKKLINLFCSCERALTKHRNLYDLLLDTLPVQVVEIPEEFLADIVTNNNFFYVKIRNLWRNIQSSDSVDGRLSSKMRRFTEFLTEKYSWDFTIDESEDEEDAPVVVELD